MDEPTVETAPGKPAPALWRRIMRWLGIGLLGILVAIILVCWGLDTGPGHRFIADRVAGIAPSSGLRIRIGRIDGSIYSRATLRDVRLYDTRGMFLEVPELRLDWRPLSWVANRLDIRSAVTDLAILYHVPKLKPSPRKRQAILPGFDIRIDRLAIRRLRVEPQVTGKRHIARILGDADIRNGRAKVHLNAFSTAGDRLRLALDAEPDRDGFDVDFRMAAPSRGVIGAGASMPFS